MFTEEITRGMDWLDRQDAATLPTGPPWFQRVDTGPILNMNHTPDCVIGQAKPGGADFNAIVDTFGETWAADHGFTLRNLTWAEIVQSDHEEHDRMWQQLTEEWRTAITLRQISG